MLAGVSHLPHVLANVLVKDAPGTPIGPSFRDATRVAGANPPLWRDIYLANRDRAQPRDRRRPRRAGRASTARCSEGDGAVAGGLAGVRGRAPARAAGGRGAPAARSPRSALVVPNRPGVVAELALALGRAGINIHDMSPEPAAPTTRAARSRSGCPRHEAARAPRRSSARERPLRAGPRGCAASRAAARTSRSPTARRSSARWPPSRSACATTSRPTDTISTLDAMRALGALVEQRRRRARDPRRRPARGARARRADRRRQRRHAHAAAAGLAGRAGRQLLPARRRRLDPAPARSTASASRWS